MAYAGAVDSLSGLDQPQVLILLDFDGTLINLEPAGKGKLTRFVFNEKIVNAIRAFRETYKDINVQLCIFTARQCLAAELTHIQDYLIRALTAAPGAKTHREIFEECLTIHKIRAEITRATGLEIVVASAYDCDYVGEYYEKVLFPDECIESFGLLEYFKEAIDIDPAFREELFNYLLKFISPKRYEKYNHSEYFARVLILILKDFLVKRQDLVSTDYGEKREIERIETSLTAIFNSFNDVKGAYFRDANFVKADKLCAAWGISEYAYKKTLMLLQVLAHFYKIDAANHPSFKQLAIFFHEDSDSVIESLRKCEHDVVKAGCCRMVIFKEPDCLPVLYEEGYGKQLHRLLGMDLRPWTAPPAFIYFSDELSEASISRAALPVMSALRLSSEAPEGSEGPDKRRDLRSGSEATVTIGKK